MRILVSVLVDVAAILPFAIMAVVFAWLDFALAPVVSLGFMLASVVLTRWWSASTLAESERVRLYAVSQCNRWSRAALRRWDERKRGQALVVSDEEGA